LRLASGLMALKPNGQARVGEFPWSTCGSSWTRWRAHIFSPTCSCSSLL
jgi:hypothetical protein